MDLPSPTSRPTDEPHSLAATDSGKDAYLAKPSAPSKAILRLSTQESMLQADTVGTAAIRVSDNALRLALCSIAQSCGLQIIDNEIAANFQIADKIADATYVHVLVVKPIPLPAAIALCAIHAGFAGGVISSDEPEMLTLVVASIRKGLLTIPASLVELARLPSMTTRQHRLLSILTYDHVKIPVLAKRLGYSVATVKRELLALYEMFNASSRHNLADIARALGYDAHQGDLDKFLNTLALAGTDLRSAAPR